MYILHPLIPRPRIIKEEWGGAGRKTIRSRGLTSVWRMVTVSLIIASPVMDIILKSDLIAHVTYSI